MQTTNTRVSHYNGIAPSVRGTGIAILTIAGEVTARDTCRIAIKKLTGPKLLHLQCNEFLNFILRPNLQVRSICIEAPSLGSQNRADDMGQVRGAYNLCCMLNFWPGAIPREIPPNSLKKFFSGIGSANKNKMIAAAIAKGWDVNTDDEADAAGLAELAWALHDESLTLTRKQLEAIRGIENMAKFPISKQTHFKTLNI